MMCKSPCNLGEFSALVIFAFAVLNPSINAAETYRKLSDGEIKAKLAGMS